MASNNQINVQLNFTANTAAAKKNIEGLQQTLNQLAVGNSALFKADATTAEIQKVSTAATELQYHLSKSLDANGALNLKKLNASLKTAGVNINQLSSSLLSAGSGGAQAFVQLSTAISQANVEASKLNLLSNRFFKQLKRTAEIQISNTIYQTLTNGLKNSYEYAQELNKSLNDIRIVSGQSTQQMAEFAKYANKAAQALSSNTTAYTNAALIYYQQGLSDEQVIDRTDVTIKMANVTGDAAKTVSDQMTAIWNNFYDGSRSLEYYADVLTALGAATASSTDEIAEGVEKFAAIGKVTGLSYEYATAALATLVDRTRQSADTVGTSLKTIFSRLQGLQLGETLDDGLDLNKYSKALATVGVQVLDVNGQMRDMDTILGDLASRWTTLNQGQKMALAQTVAGVRQYNNLISLMDNWDFMEQNLQVAYNSEGTINEQADIYAESWEAAKNRTKAALEDIYQDLIDDKMFIKVQDFITSVIQGVNKVIENIGGFKGVLLAVASIMASKIQPLATKIGQSLMTAFANPQIAYNNVNKKFDQQINEIKNETSQDKFQWKDFTKSQQFQLESNSQIGKARSKYSMAEDMLNEKERFTYQTQIAQMEMMSEKIVKLAEAYEQLNSEREQYLQSITNETSNILVDKAKTEVASATGDRWPIGSKEGQKVKDTLANFKVEIKNVKSVDEFEEKIKSLEKSLLDLSDGTDISKKKINELIVALTKKSLGETWLDDYKSKVDQTINKIDFSELEAGQKAEIDVALNNFNGASGIKETTAALNELIQKLVEANLSGDDLTNALQSMGFGGSSGIANLANLTDEMRAKLKQAGVNLEKLKAQADGFNVDHIASTLEKLGSLTSSFINISMGIQQIKGGLESFENGETLQGITQVLSALMMFIPVYKSLKTAKVANIFLNKQIQRTAEEAAAAEATATLGLTIALTILISLITYFVNQIKEAQQKIEELRQEHIELADNTYDLSNANQELISTYDQLLDRYHQLKGAGEDTLDVEQQLIEKAKELGDAYGVAGANLLEFNGKYDEFFDLIEKNRQKEISTNIPIYKQGYADASANFVDELKKSQPFNQTGNSYAYTVQGSSNHKRADQEALSIFDLNSSQFSHIIKTAHSGQDAGFNLELKTDQFDNAEELLSLYEEAQSLYNLMDTSLSESVKKNSGIFKNLRNFIVDYKENYEEVKKFKDYLEENNIEGTALNLEEGPYKISSAEEYIDFRKNLIEQLANEKQITDQTSKSYQELTNAVDAYLGTISSIGDYKKYGDALQDWMNINGITDINEIKQLLNKDAKEQLTDQDLDILLLVDPTLNNKALEAAINLARVQVEKNTLQLKIEGVLSGKELLNNKETTADDWKTYYEENKDSFNGVSLGDFLALSNTEKEKIIENSALKMGNVEVGEILQQQDIARQFLDNNANTTNLTTYEEIKNQAESQMAIWQEKADVAQTQVGTLTAAKKAQDNRYNGNTEKIIDQNGQGEYTADFTEWLKRNGWASAEDYNAAINYADANATTLETDLAQQQNIVDSNSALITQSKAALNILKPAEQDTTSWYNNLVETANNVDLDIDEISDFAQNLRDASEAGQGVAESLSELSDTTGDTDATARATMQLATALKIAQKGYDSLSKNIDTYKENLVQSKRGTVEYNDSLNDLREDTEQLFGIDASDFDASWFEENIDLFDKMAQGGEEAEQAYSELQQKIVDKKIEVSVDGEGAKTQLNNLLTQAQANLADNNFEIGASLDTSGVEGSFQELLDSGAITAEQMNDILSTMGWAPDIQYQTVQIAADQTAAGSGETAIQLPGSDQVKIVSNATMRTNSDGSVSIPIINAKTSVYKGKTGGASMPKKSGGGGGGGSKKTKEKKPADNKDRYHTVDQQLEDLSNQLDELGDAEDRAFGAEKIKTMAREMAKLNEQVAKYNDKLVEAKNYLTQDRAKAEDFASKIGMSIQYGSNGEILNWDELKKGYLDWYNAGVDKYNAGGIDDDAFSKQYDDVYSDAMDAFDQLEETNNLVQELQQNILDTQRKYEDMYLAIQKEKLEINITIDENGMKLLEYFFDKLNDDLYDSVERMSILEDQIGNLINQASAYEQNINGLLGTAGQWDGLNFNSYGLTLEDLPELLSKSNKELYEIFGGAGSNVQEIIDQLQKDYEKLLDTNKQITETRQKLIEEIGSSFSSWNEEIDKAENKLEQNAQLMEHYRNVIDIVGRKTLGITSKFIKDYNIKQLDNDLAQLSASYAQLNEQREAVSALEQAIMRETSEETKALMQKELDGMRDTLNEQVEDTAQKWEDCMRGIQEAYEDTVSVALDDWQTKMAGLAGSADMLQLSFDMATDIDDNYLDDYDKIYELSKLSADINNSIDDTDNIQSKEDLVALMEKVNELNESDADISQYTVDVLRARYELLKAEDALKEAQNAKSTVRLTQDNEGNWGYVYTADQDAVSQAEQEYADKLHALEEINQNYINDLDQKLADLTKNASEKINQIAQDSTLTLEEKKEKIQEVYEYTNEMERYLMEQTQLALEDAMEIYEVDAQKYSELTGNKMLDDEKWVNSFEEMKIAQITGFTELQDWDQQFSDSWDDTVRSLLTTTDEFVEKNAEAFDTVKMDIKNASEEMGDDLNQIADDTNKVRDSIIDMGADAEQTIVSVIDYAKTWSSEWSTAIDAIISKNELLAKSCDTIISKLANAQAANDALNQAEAEEAQKQAEQQANSGSSNNSSSGGNYTYSPGQGGKDPEYNKKRKNNGGCFAPDTKVLMADLTEKEIQYIELGDMVMSYDEISQIFIPKQVTKIYPHYNTPEMVKIIFQNDMYIELTPGHPILSQFGWRSLDTLNSLFEHGVIAKELQYNDIILGYNNNYSIQLIQELNIGNNYTSYNLEVEDYHTFITNGIIAHNKKVNLGIFDTGGYTGTFQYADTGMYTGQWANGSVRANGRLAFLHQKELVLNAHDTENFLQAVDIVRNLNESLDLGALSMSKGLGNITARGLDQNTAQTIDQNVSIKAEFPNVQDKNEIEEAFNNLINKASQYANRKNK